MIYNKKGDALAYISFLSYFIHIYGYVKREIISKYSMRGTVYAPIMMDVVNKYLKEDLSALPVYSIFITDGDNNTTKLMKKIQSKPIFWQFIGVGDDSISYLEQLDDMGSREIDNANEYPSWLNIVRNKGLIR